MQMIYTYLVHNLITQSYEIYSIICGLKKTSLSKNISVFVHIEKREKEEERKTKHIGLIVLCLHTLAHTMVLFVMNLFVLSILTYFTTNFEVKQSH